MKLNLLVCAIRGKMTPTKKEKGNIKMNKINTYGYEVKGDTKVLEDITEFLKDKHCKINWFNFITGDIYYTADGFSRYKVTIDHNTKQVTLDALQ